MSTTLIVIVLLLMAIAVVSYLLLKSSTGAASIISKLKWIGAGIIGIGGAILAIILFFKPKSASKTPGSTPLEERIGATEQRITEDKAKIEAKGKEIKQGENAIQAHADDTKKKNEEIKAKPEQPGDAGKAATDFTDTWNK